MVVAVAMEAEVVMVVSNLRARCSLKAISLIDLSKNGVWSVLVIHCKYILANA